MKRVVVALLVLAGWMAVNVFGQRLQTRGHVSLTELVSGQVVASFVVAPILLMVVVALSRAWREVGLQAPRSARSLTAACLPGVYVIGLLALAAVSGLPAGSVVAVILVNTALVGISEELMFRGVLLAGAMSRFSLWTAVWLSSLLFGAVHALNGFLTGDFAAAFVQAAAAAMVGVYFAAVRLRTGSLYPGMAIHFLWDFAAILLASSNGDFAGEPRPGPALLAQLPLMAYGLWLISREVKTQKGSPPPERR